MVVCGLFNDRFQSTALQAIPALFYARLPLKYDKLVWSVWYLSAVKRIALVSLDADMLTISHEQSWLVRMRICCRRSTASAALSKLWKAQVFGELPTRKSFIFGHDVLWGCFEPEYQRCTSFKLVGQYVHLHCLFPNKGRGQCSSALEENAFSGAMRPLALREPTAELWMCITPCGPSTRSWLTW